MPTSLTSTEKKTLRTLIPLAKLPEKQFDELCALCNVHNGTPGTLLFQQGDRSSLFYYLLSGKVSFKIGDVQVETIESGSPPAQFALAHQFPRKVSASALTNIRYVCFESENISVDTDESHEQHSIGDEVNSITHLLLANEKKHPTENMEAEYPDIPSNTHFFKRLNTGLFRRKSVKKASDNTLPQNVQNDDTQPALTKQESGEIDKSAIQLANETVSSQQRNQCIIQENQWKQSLPEETIDKLKTVVLPLMQNVSDISGSLVTTNRGSFRSPDFPEHRIKRIMAIVTAASSNSHEDNPDYPEEILVRESNSQILIVLIGNKGLLALNANISANLGLIRLEAYPVISQIRKIIAPDTAFPSAHINKQ